MKRHIVLVGLPGAGKTTIGQLVAEQLQAAFVDIDAILTRKEGKPITMIFAEKGEAAFRDLERAEMTTALASATPTVIAPGGGWASQPGAIEAAQPTGWLVYLKTRPESAGARAAPQGNRPLLSGDDPVVQMRDLLKEREPFYKRAEATVETDKKTPAQVTAEVVRLARTGAGW